MQLDATDADGRTALHWAAFHGKHRMIKLLLDYGATASVKDGEGRCARCRPR
jgi:ankyrin repeat protein